MMPYCSVKRCKRVADVKLGTIDTGEKYLKNSDRTWEEVVYVCKKHQTKLLKKLGFESPVESKEESIGNE